MLTGQRHWAGLWFGVAAFGAVFGVVMVSTGAWAGWFLVLTFVPSAVILGMALRPQSNELRLDREGYTVTSVFRSTTTRWSDVERVGTIEGSRTPFVAIRLAPGAASIDPESAAIANAMGGYHRTLPMTYGVPAEELAGLMRRYLNR